MIILQGNTLYTVFTSCKMKVLDQRILNTLASSEILKLTCDVNRWLRLLNFYSCVEYNQVKFCLYTFSPPGMDCYFCNKFKKMGNSWVVLIWNKDYCHWASIWWGRWSPTVLWRQKCLFKSAFRLNDIEYHLSGSWGCFQTLMIQKGSSDLTVYLSGEWNTFYLLHSCLEPLQQLLFLLSELSPNLPIYSKDCSKPASATSIALGGLQVFCPNLNYSYVDFLLFLKQVKFSHSLFFFPFSGS